MNCPTCALPLLITERQGIEIDYCQTCRGVWLDRGELDKLIERGSASGPTHAPAQQYKKESAGYGSPHRREHENPIADLFDFF